MVEVMSKQHLGLALLQLKGSVLVRLNESFFLEGEWIVEVPKEIVCPNVDRLRDRILQDDHGSNYSIHKGSRRC